MNTLLIVLVVLLAIFIGAIVYMIFSIIRLTHQIKHLQQSALEMNEKLSSAKDKASLMAFGSELATVLVPKIISLKKHFNRGKSDGQATRKTSK